MLQKFFNRTRATLRRSSKDLDTMSGKKSHRLLQRTESLDSNSTDATKNTSDLPVSNGKMRTAPVADVEHSPEIEGGSKKVHFQDGLTSPEQSLDIIEDDVLFDGSVLEAFQVGQLSIAEFLKSPHPSPDVNKTEKKSRSMSDSEVKTTPKNKTPNSSPSLKKQSLLDRAHSMGSKGIRKISAPVFQKRVTEEHSETDEFVKDGNDTKTVCSDTKVAITATKSDASTLANSNSTEPSSTKPLVRDDKPRFSKSLETLAQEVFGDEFQAYLADASKSPVKISFAKTATTTSKNSSSPKENDSTVKRLKPKRAKSMSPRYNYQDSQNDVKCPQTEPPNRRSDFIKNEPKSRSLTRTNSSPRSTLLRVTKMDASRSVDIPCNAGEDVKFENNLESWNNTLDLRSGTSLASNDSLLDNQRMVSIIEGNVIVSPRDGNDRQRTKSTGSMNSQGSFNINCSLHSFANRKYAKIPKADSEDVNYGSFGEKELSSNESSVIDIQFPPPPPIDDDFCLTGFEGPTESPYSSQEGHLDFDNPSDPLIESLMSIVPLPEKTDQLVPALSKALSEIVSEIVASRCKLNRILKAIEIHQQILKDQTKQIQAQSKEIAELRKTAYALNNYQTVHRRDSGKLRKPNSTRSNRQSREMVELNYTLDRLLYQCSTLQKTPRSENTEETNTPNEPDNSLRRSNTFPSRKLTYTKVLQEEVRDSNC